MLESALIIVYSDSSFKGIPEDLPARPFRSISKYEIVTSEEYHDLLDLMKLSTGASSMTIAAITILVLAIAASLASSGLASIVLESALAPLRLRGLALSKALLATLLPLALLAVVAAAIGLPAGMATGRLYLLPLMSTTPPNTADIKGITIVHDCQPAARPYRNIHNRIFNRRPSTHRFSVVSTLQALPGAPPPGGLEVHNSGTWCRG